MTKAKIHRRIQKENNHGDIRLPRHVLELFWEYDKKKITWRNDSDLVIGKVLQNGQWQSIKWLIKAAGHNGLRKWFIRHQGAGLEAKKLRFWQLVLELPSELVDKWVEAFFANPWSTRCGETISDYKMAKQPPKILVFDKNNFGKELYFEIGFMLPISSQQRKLISEHLCREVKKQTMKIWGSSSEIIAKHGKRIYTF